MLNFSKNYEPTPNNLPQNPSGTLPGIVRPALPLNGRTKLLPKASPYTSQYSFNASILPDNGQFPLDQPGYPMPLGHHSPINTTLVETGVASNGESDNHARSVEGIVKTNDPDGQVNMVGTVDPNAPPDPSADLNFAPYSNITTKESLNKLVDTSSTDALDKMSNQIKKLTQSGQTNVINASFGFCRSDVYGSVMQALMQNPSLAPVVGLDPTDTAKIVADSNNQLQAPQNVSDAVVHYVDNQLNAPDSAFQKSLVNYQDVTHQAAQKGIVTVVASGNNHKDAAPFTAHGALGADTSFLAESQDVISVAASTKADDGSSGRKIADFSSWGDGQYNPTISANGVGVDTKYGPQDGTSFAAPQVTATVARMLQNNPNLTFQQVKTILQNTATDIVPNNTDSDGAGDINPDQAVAQADAMKPAAPSHMRSASAPPNPTRNIFSQIKFEINQLFMVLQSFNQA